MAEILHINWVRWHYSRWDEHCLADQIGEVAVAKRQTSFDLDESCQTGSRFVRTRAHLWRSKPPKLSRVLRRTRHTRPNEETDVTDRALALLARFFPKYAVEMQAQKDATDMAASPASPSFSHARPRIVDWSLARTCLAFQRNGTGYKRTKLNIVCRRLLFGRARASSLD
jgi:hypothetical protein